MYSILRKKYLTCFGLNQWLGKRLRKGQKKREKAFALFLLSLVARRGVEPLFKE